MVVTQRERFAGFSSWSMRQEDVLIEFRTQLSDGCSHDPVQSRRSLRRRWQVQEDDVRLCVPLPVVVGEISPVAPDGPPTVPPNWL